MFKTKLENKDITKASLPSYANYAVGKLKNL